MIDANQAWGVPQAIEYMKKLANIKPWFIEGPTAPDKYVPPSPALAPRPCLP